MFRILLLVVFATSATGTSLSPELHECPVCGVKSVTVSINSYSQFGEPARDLSDSPRFRFASVEICPGDLYASWSSGWGEIDATEKAQLAGFLEKPALHLTKAEKSIVSGHEEAFRKSAWFKPLWARTCDEFRAPDQRGEFLNMLRLHFEGRREFEEDWEKELGSLYREEAISALKEAVTAKWSKPHEKRVFAYLRGELVRQAGRDEEALGIFQEVIDAEEAAEPDEDLAWISRWAMEQSLRCSPEGKDPGKLMAAIIPELPDPWRVEKATEDPRWVRHSAALDLLARGAAEGKKGFSDGLWKFLDRKPERLLALLETINSNIDRLPSVDARWNEWFDEIKTDLNTGKPPASLAGDPNKERVNNVLRSAVDGGDRERMALRNDVLLPAVRKAAEDGGIPVLAMPGSERFPELPPLDDQESNEKAVEEPSLNDLSRDLYSLWEEQPGSARPDIARVYIRILREEPDELESMKYPVAYFLPEIAESEEGRALIANEMDGEWKSSFGKAACAYAARLPDTSQAFLNHPLTAKTDPALLVKLLLQRSDAGWKEEAIRKLKEDVWLSPSIVKYLHGLDLPETRTTLEKFANKVRGEKVGTDPDGRLSTVEDIEELQVEKRLRQMPVR